MDCQPGSSDQIQVVEWLRVIWVAVSCPEWREMRAILRRLRAETSAILDRRWVHVQAVGNRLLAQEELNRAEVESLLVGLRPEGTEM